MRRTSITHEFVEYTPVVLTEGVLYVSITYRTAVHRCACGCGNKVVTPISPVDWQLLYDGDTISLTPSIGNWGLPLPIALLDQVKPDPMVRRVD